MKIKVRANGVIQVLGNIMVIVHVLIIIGRSGGLYKFCPHFWQSDLMAIIVFNFSHSLQYNCSPETFLLQSYFIISQYRTEAQGIGKISLHLRPRRAFCYCNPGLCVTILRFSRGGFTGSVSSSWISCAVDQVLSAKLCSYSRSQIAIIVYC